MTKRKFDEFELFLIDNFANNESEWNKFTPLFASNFLEDFFKNLNYMQAQLDVFQNMKIKKISLTEKKKLIRILAISDLSDCIHIYNEDKQYWIDLVSIQKTFKKASKTTSASIAKTVGEM
ncbi:hypothetical protein [Williamsoniiplasma luminosum]|uniref:Uncharacterized protein n=1 Tax=Williamsoniiplasma luminosum TaxID=214888 RepID=A0A2S0NK47_9MOLU|nr:hypothetical protein [Williamsoniiplasma luminosum]AVP49384.1 MAG: hypothetical protein C5T88_02180 [Williamsoniiplasma luminosum]